MNQEKMTPRLNVPLLLTLLVVAAGATISVLTSGQESYAVPAPIGQQFTPRAVEDPRTLAPTIGVIYSLDVIRNGTRDERIGHDPLLVDARQRVSLTGWSIDAVDHQPSLAVYARVDNGPVRHVTPATARADVVRLFHSEESLGCGFAIPLEVGRLAPGRHTLDVWLTTSDGVAAAHPRSLRLIVAPRSA